MLEYLSDFHTTKINIKAYPDGQVIKAIHEVDDCLILTANWKARSYKRDFTISAPIIDIFIYGPSLHQSERFITITGTMILVRKAIRLVGWSEFLYRIL